MKGTLKELSSNLRLYNLYSTNSPKIFKDILCLNDAKHTKNNA